MLFICNTDWVLEDHVVQTHIVPNQDLCYAHCIRDKLHRCRSLNYQNKTDASNTKHQCDINYSTKNRYSGSMKERPGWVYEEVSVKSLPASQILQTKKSLYNFLLQFETLIKMEMSKHFPNDDSHSKTKI